MDKQSTPAQPGAVQEGPTKAQPKNGARPEPPIRFHPPRKKPLAEVTAKDIPRGLDPEDVAVDCPQRPWR